MLEKVCVIHCNVLFGILSLESKSVLEEVSGRTWKIMIEVANGIA